MSVSIVLAWIALCVSEAPRATPALPAAPLSTEIPTRAAGTPELLYINFDGGVLQGGCGNEARFNCSTLASLFDGYIGPFPGNLNQRIAILQATRKAVAEFGVRVVLDRPPDTVDYTMVMYGDLGDQDFAGVAPYIDCEDVYRNDTSFAGAFDGSNTGSTVILQEAAHTWGLEHVDSEFDLLNPFKSAGLTQRFLDECLPIVANTDLQTTPGTCNKVHTKFCDSGYQNSWQEMHYLFGDPIPDTQAPTLELTSPLPDETFVLPIRIPLAGTIRDELDPQFYHLQVYSGDQLLFEDDIVQLDLLLENPPPDDYELRLVLKDQAGNSSETAVSFTVLPEGSELPDPVFDDPAPGGSGCSLAPRPANRAAWLVVCAMATMLPRRRRSSSRCPGVTQPKAV